MTQQDTTTGGPIVPPVLYLPVADVPDDSGLPVELRRTADGRMALLAYTALDRLADCCGPDQPWALVPTPDIERLGIGYDVIYLDLEIPAELQHRSEG